MIKHGIALGLMAMLAGCGINNQNDHLFEGERYRHKARAVDGRGDHDFTVTVSPVSAGFSGAMQAAAYEATKHCVTNFGTSDIAWTLAPDSDPAAIPLDGDTATLAGTCIEP